MYLLTHPDTHPLSYPYRPIVHSLPHLFAQVLSSWLPNRITYPPTHLPIHLQTHPITPFNTLTIACFCLLACTFYAYHRLLAIIAQVVSWRRIRSRGTSRYMRIGGQIRGMQSMKVGISIPCTVYITPLPPRHPIYHPLTYPLTLSLSLYTTPWPAPLPTPNP